VDGRSAARARPAVARINAAPKNAAPRNIRMVASENLNEPADGSTKPSAAVMAVKLVPVPWLGFMVTLKLNVTESASSSKFLMLRESIRREFRVAHCNERERNCFTVPTWFHVMRSAPAEFSTLAVRHCKA
jgi:hypothetical protein